MTLAPTLYGFDVALCHVDKSIDESVVIRTARHPSETLERVWLRVIAYCLFFEERLAFGPGLCEPDAPDLHTEDLTGRRTRWVRVGKTEPLKLQRAVDQNRGASVSVLFESPARMAELVFAARDKKIERLSRVELVAADPALIAALAAKDSRRDRFTLTIADDHLYVDRDGETLSGGLARTQID